MMIFLKKWNNTLAGCTFIRCIPFEVKRQIMKRYIFAALLFVCPLIVINAQHMPTDTASFMNGYRQLVAYTELQAIAEQSVIDSLAIRNDSIKRCFRFYEPQLSNKQIKEYNQLKSRMSRQFIRLRSSKIGNGIRNTADSVTQKANRIGNAIGGYIEGILY